uniref:Uncharacterized protein n=1 Tax=Anguilla anguilla TaxID=7936 RepID=A0A0E9RR12_ANGAN
MFPLIILSFFAGRLEGLKFMHF